MRIMARWAWLVVLIVGLALFEAVRKAVTVTENPNLVPSLILLGATVAPVSFVTFIGGRRLPYQVGAGTVGLVALLGGVLGVVTAGVLEYDTMRDLGVLPMSGVAVIEESAKLLVPVCLLVFVRPERVADGLLLGVASGAGFAVLETMGYAFVAFISSGGNLHVADAVLFQRGVLSPAAHMAWTGLTASALWYAAVHGFSRPAAGRFAGAFVLAVVLHTAWDSLGNLAGYAVLVVISLGLLVVVTERLAPRRLVATGAGLPAAGEVAP